MHVHQSSEMETFYRTYRPKVFQYAMRLVASPSEADDLVQEVFLLLQTRQSEWRGIANVNAWLAKVTLNVARHQWRARKRAARRDTAWGSDAVPTRVPTPLERLEAKRGLRQLEKAIESLRPLYRSVYWLTEVNELPAAEVAVLVGVPPQTVRVQRLRARRQVCQHYQAAVGA
ncbi:MAG TPA: sigma-70 family RNA polymerase sigma factor [Polyangia bacterium]|nr:sigma-70 family RNA polymerase sigma factor [Polyangia bacterium]